MRTLALLAAAAAFTTHAALAQDGPQMTASVINVDGEEIGNVTFTQTPSGILHIVADISDIPEGVHGFHVHEVGECDPATEFKSAGGHYAADKKHGLVEGGPHPGDLPNAHVQGDGILMVEYFTDRMSIGGENPLDDADGSAVMVHSDPDDYESQPSGAAGSRIACGVIE